MDLEYWVVRSKVLILIEVKLEYKRWKQKLEISSSTTKATVFHFVSLSISSVLVDSNIQLYLPTFLLTLKIQQKSYIIGHVQRFKCCPIFLLFFKHNFKLCVAR
jgi:hypothetical protein